MTHHGECPDVIAGRGCQACDDWENDVATNAGHPEACWYTLKASVPERFAHYRSREPSCDAFEQEASHG